MQTLSQLIVKILKKPKKGIYNLGSNGSISKYQFALEINKNILKMKNY